MLRKFGRSLLDLIYPNRCPVCGELIPADGEFCKRCTDELTPFTDEFKPLGADGFTAAFEYNDKIKPAVMLLKDGICGNAAFALGKALARRLTETGLAENSDLLIPVPLHKRDKRRRGYNQSELIAKVIEEELCVPMQRNILVKQKLTDSQKTLSAAERRVNLSGAFSVTDTSALCGKIVILIDDVCTTGSTMAELTSLLKRCGAAQVRCASCCKTMKQGENHDGSH